MLPLASRQCSGHTSKRDLSTSIILFNHASLKWKYSHEPPDEPSTSEPALLADVDVVVFGWYSGQHFRYENSTNREAPENAKLQAVGGYSLRFTEELVFPPVRILVQSHCITTSELCMPQFEQSMRKACPL